MIRVRYVNSEKERIQLIGDLLVSRWQELASGFGIYAPLGPKVLPLPLHIFDPNMNLRFFLNTSTTTTDAELHQSL